MRVTVISVNIVHTSNKYKFKRKYSATRRVRMYGVEFSKLVIAGRETGEREAGFLTSKESHSPRYHVIKL